MVKKLENKIIGQIKELENILNSKILGREKMVRSVMLSLINGENVLIKGLHGEGKSMLLHLIKKHSNTKTFYKQIHGQTSLQDILGVINALDFKLGKLDIIKTDFWDSNIQFYDECLRNSELLDFLLEVMVERKCSKSVLGEIDLTDLISVIATTNPTTEHYHTEELDYAMLDRFGYIVEVGHLIKDDITAFRKVIREVNENNGNDIKTIIEFDIEKLKGLSKMVKDIKISEDEFKLMNMFFINCLNENVEVSTRLSLKLKKSIQTLAFYNGRNVTNEKDFKDSLELIFRYRFDEKVYHKITEKLFNREEFELSENIINLNMVYNKQDVHYQEVFDSTVKFLKYYKLKNKNFVFFSDDTKQEITKIFGQINIILESHIGTMTMNRKIDSIKELIEFKNLIELNQFFKNIDLSIQTSYMDLIDIDKMEKGFIKSGFLVSKKTQSNKARLEISISVLDDVTIKSLDKFQKLNIKLDSEDKLSKF